MNEQRIVVNGVEYGSAAEMPPDVRALYERALHAAAEAGAAGSAQVSTFAGQGANQVTVQTVQTSTRFIVDGREYGSVDELPAGARAALRDALGASSPNRLTYPADRRAEDEPEADYGSSGGRRLRFTASVSPVRLTIWVAAILVLLYYIFLRRG